MLDRNHLQKTLTTLIKGKSDFALFGNKSSGKTFLLKKILDLIYGQNRYLTIKCIFISDRGSLLYLVGEEMGKLFAALNSDMRNQINFEKQYQNLGIWLADINKTIAKHEQFFKKLPPIYMLLDNIQSFNLNQTFFKNFYYGIKKQLKHIKISFIFCGISMMSPLFYVNEPLRLLPTFTMPQPDIRGIIISGVEQSQLAQRVKSMDKGQRPIIEKLLKVLKSNLQASFEATEFEIERTIRITKQFMKYINQLIGQKPQINANALLKNEQTIKQAFKKLHEHGPVSLERLMSQNVKKQIGQNEVEQQQPTFYLENYPSLLATSLGLANGYPQTEDLKRFMDLSKVKSSKQKAMMKNKNSDFGFKRQNKKIRHNAMRIIGISEVLEQQSSCPKRLMEKNRDIYPHHTLDYYGCIEYLRDEGYLSYYGRTSGKFGGTIMGTAKQSQVKDFLNKIGLQYKQFTGID